MKYRVQVWLIREVQIDVELPANTAGCNVEAAAIKAASEEYGAFDHYEVPDFERIAK